MQQTTAITEHERRLSAALDRIGRAIDGIGGTAPMPQTAAPQPVGRRAPPAAAAPDAAQAAEITRLREALETERTANAQLTERLRAIKAREGQSRGQLETRVEVMTRQLDVQGLELTRMRKTTIQLRDTLRALTEAAAAATPDPHLINRAMLTELEALRALRQTEVAEMDEILTALAPLLEEVPTDA